MKKLLSLALVVVMLFSMIPSTIFAKPMDAGAPTKSNVVDATISEGEYSWTSGQFDRNVNIANEVHVVTAYNADNVYNGGNKVLYSQIWMGYDEDYIYLAYRERGGYPSCVWLDLNPCIGLENSRSQLSLLVNGSTYGGSQHTAYDATDIIKIYAYSDVGVSVQEETSKYVVEAQKSFYDDGAMIVNTFEIKVSRAALAEYASRFNEGTTSFDKLGFRSFIQSDYTKTSAEVFYADNDSEYKAFGSHANRGFHVFDVSGNVSDETQTPETEPAETEPTETQPVETEPPAPVVDLKGYELTAYDQQLYFIGKDTSDKAYANSLDTIDGKIAVGEYTWSVTLDPKKDAEDKSFFRNGNPVDLVSMTINAVVHDGYLYLATVVEDTGNVNGWQDYVFGWLGYGEYTRHTTERFILPRAGSQIEFPSGNHTPDTIGSAGLSIDKFKVASVGDLTTYEWRYDLSKYENSNMLYFGLAYVTSDQFIKFGFETNDNLGQNSKLDNQARDMYPHVLFLGDKDDFSELGESFVNCTNHTYANGVFISDTEHRVVCTTCGTVDYLAHTLVPTGGTEPTYTQPGALTYACEAGLCGGKFDPQVPALGIPEDKHLLTLTEQKQFFVAKSTDDNSTTPVMNGVIDELEYNWSALDVEGFSNTANVTGVDVYFTYDDENVYVAIRVDDASEHVNYTTCARLYINGSENIDDAWNIYLTKANGTGVEHWQITDGASSINLWDPIDSKNSEAHKNGQGDKHYVFGQSYANGVYTYEISLNRAEWGLSGNKIFLGVRAIDRDNKDFIYGFKSDDLGTEPAILGAYPHVMFLGEKSAFADYLADTTLAYTPCENHAYGDVLVGENMHKQICTVCGAVNVAAHTFGEQTTTIAPSFGVAGYSYKTCTLDGCGATQVVEGSEQYFDPNANATGTTQYTLWQNNIMQNSIQENCYANTNHKDLDHDRNGDGVVDGKDEYYFLPSVTKDMWSKGTTNGRYQDFYATLDTYMPDIVALQECDYGWHVVIDTHGEIVDGKFGSFGANTVENGYTYTYNGKSVTTYPIAKLGYASVFEGHATIDKLGVRSPIYYNTAVFELVEANIDLYNASGYYENAFVFAWAILKAKATGEYVAVTSTHLPADYSGKDSGLATRNSYVQNTILPKIEEFETVYNIPVISVGDWNADIYEDGMVALNNVMNTGRENALVGKNLSWMTSGNSLGNRPYDANNLPSTVYLGPNGDEVYRKSDDARIGSQIDHCFYSEAGIAGDEWEVRIDDNSYCDHVPALFTFRIVGVNHECEDVSAKAWTKLDDTKHFRKCVCNAKYEEAAHNVTSYIQNADGVTHSGACADCGETVTLACTSANANYEQTATAHSFTCSVCAGTVSADHNYKWTFTGTTADDTHTKTCDVCGYVAVNTAKHVFDDGKMTTPGTYSAPGVRTFSCECGASYTKKWVVDAHFLRGLTHRFVGNAMVAAPVVDGKLSDAEYSWTTGVLQSTGKQWSHGNTLAYTAYNNTTPVPTANSVASYLAHDSEHVYIAITSTLGSGVAQPGTQNAWIFLGGSDSISKILEIKLTFKNGVLTSATSYHNVLDNGTYNYGTFPTSHPASTDATDIANAKACIANVNASIDDKTNTLVYEVAIDRTALATLCGAEAELDRLYYQFGLDAVSGSTGKVGGYLFFGCGNGEYRGVNYVWADKPIESSDRGNGVHNSRSFLYVNGSFPNVIFLSTKTAQSAYLADTDDHKGYNAACTAHSYRLVYAGNDTHKNVCVLCGAEEAAVACTMSAWAFADNGVHAKACDVCKYVVYEEHTLGEVTSGNNGTHSQTCSVCTGTVTNNCIGEWAKTETTHATTCTICGYTMPAEEHKFTYTSTGTTVNDTHTGKCSVCEYTTAAAKHTFGDPVGDPEGTFNTIAYAKYTCTTCGAFYKVAYAPDGHFLTAYKTSPFAGQQHFFAGVESVAPNMDGKVGATEYSIEIGGMTPSKSGNWQFHNDGYNTWGATTTTAAATTEGANAGQRTVVDNVIYYFAYDAEYLYLAAIKDSAVKPTGAHYQTFVINVNDKIDVKLGKTVQLTYNANGTVKVDSNGGGALVGSAAKLNEVNGRFQTVYEFKVSRAKLAELAGITSFDKLYISGMSQLYGPDGTVTGYGALLWQFTTTNLAATNTSVPAEVKPHLNASDGLNRMGHVFFLGSNDDFADYLNTKDDPILGSYYRACAEHVYRTVATDEGHKQMCQHCGQTTGDVTPHSYNGVWTTPGTTSAAGIKTYTCLCGASYTRKEVNDAHFIRGTSHVFLGNEAGVAPKADGVLGAAEYSWTSGTIGKGGTSKLGSYYVEKTVDKVEYYFANFATDYASYDDNYIYLAVVSSLEGANAGIKRTAATESARIFLGANENWNSMVGFTLTYTHATGALTSKATHYQVLKTFEGTGYANLATIDNQSADKVTKTDASACLVDVVAKYDAATNSLVYELVIDRAALAAACGNDTKLDRIFFQTGVTGITSAGAASGWLITRNSSEFRGCNFVYGSDEYVWASSGKTDDGTRANAVHNSHDFPYINGTFPHVMFLSTKTAQASYLGDNEVHKGWNAACTAHSFRTVIASETAHKQVCNLCGFEQTVENHVYDNTCDTTCNTCGYVREITHTEGAAATCTAAQTCTVCGIELAPALGHTELTQKAAAVPATCTVDGKTAIMGCERCDALNEGGETITAAGHKYDGELDADCNVCGETRDVTCTHSYNKEVTEPTCTTAGYTTYTCSKCGDTYKDDEIVAAGHKYDAKVTDPTCEAEGYTTHTCSVCGDSYVDTKVDATGHATKVVDNKNGTHSTVCDTCGEVISTANCEYGANVSADADNHKKTCDVCGNVVTAAHKLAWSSTGNTASDKHTKACSDCGYVAVAETAHDFGDGVWVTKPTPTTSGKKTYTCECGATYTLNKVAPSDNHFLRNMKHFFLGNAMDIAPEVNGIVNPAEYSFTLGKAGGAKAATGTSNIGGSTTVAWRFDNAAKAAINKATVYVSYDEDNVYVAIISALEGDYANVNRPATETVYVYLGGSDSISRIVGVKATYTTATEALVTDMLYYNVTAEKSAAYFANDAFASSDATLNALAEACLVDSAAKFDEANNALAFEFAISREALAEACGSEDVLDMLFFQPAISGINASGGTAGWFGTGYEYRSSNTPYYDKVNGTNTSRGDHVDNPLDYLYVNGTFPNVIFFSTKANQSAYLADNAEHTGWNTACTAHSFRTVIASETAHKQVCNLCGFEQTVENHVFDNTCDTTCNTCGYVREITHTWADADCDTPKTCSVCGATEGTALGHTWADATCTAPKTCETCGATEGTALGHDWADADCTTPKTCETCGATEGEALGHAWADADCTTPKTCEICGTTEGEALGHTWADATCTAPKTCETCGATEGEALGHTWADADCDTPKTCKTCGAKEGTALGHEAGAAATCTTAQTCIRCDYVFVEALGHDWADADCDTPKTCKVCGETEGEALGHNEVAIPAVDATCTAEGATAGVKCDRCNEVLKAPVATPKAEHTYDDQYDVDCNECGFVREAVEVAAMVGEKKFATVKDAFDAAVEGDTIVVLTRIVVDGNETWDLTGKTLDIQYTMNNYVVLVKGNLTIKGGTFNIANAYGIGVQPNATLVIDGGSFTTTAENYLIGSWGTTTINGGEFNAVYCNVNGFAGTLTINGGEFTIGGYTGEYDALDVLAGDGVATIFGGSFSTDISEYIAKGYIATVVDGRYIVAACTHQNKTTTETDRVEADCTTDGSYVEIVTCDDCGNELSRETKTIDAKGHRYGNLQVFTFCLEEGYITIACGNCGAAFDSRTDVEAQDYLVEHPFFNLAAKGHTELVEKEAAVPATCTTAGKTAVMGCERCEYTEGGAAIDALGHEYDEQVTAPTCMAGGYTTYTCTRCSDSYTGNATDIVGHNIVVTDAGYSECSFGCGRIEVSNEAGLRAAIAKGGEFFVTADIAVDADNTIMVNGTSVMNLGEYVITGVSNEATANRNVFDVRGTLTVNGGTITIEHVGTDMAWNNSTNVFNVTAGGVLNVYDATIKNLGGSSMAFCVHLNNWGEVTLNAERTAFESSYIAIRVFNSGYDMNNVTLKDCDVKGAVLAFWVHNYTVVDFGTEERAEQAKAFLNLDIFNGTNNFTGKDTKPTPICYGFTDEVYFDVNGDHVHVYAEEVTDPTCTAEGYTTYTCNCGDSYVGNKVDALEHEAGAAATCTTAQTCIRCDYVFVEALGHDWADADCDTPKTCKVCGETEGEALGHDWADADCDTPKTCKVCGETEGEALGHTPGAAATCTTAQTCTVCGEMLAQATGHRYGNLQVFTFCLEEGYITIACGDCGAAFDSRTDVEAQDYLVEYPFFNLAAKGHTPGAAATCTTAQTCTVCNATLVEALDHEAGEAATCTTAQTCIRCDYVFVEALGHDWADADCDTPKTCKVCGETEGTALGHEAGEAATCTTAQTCIRCDYVFVEALGHDWADADCDTPKTCKVCGETEGTALGHNMQKTAAAVLPSCEAAGKTEVYTCANGCGKTEGGDSIDALGHNMQETEAAVAPKCEEAGKTAVLTCANGCGKTEGGEVVPETGHSEITVPAVDATCTATGLTEGKKCKNCGVITVEQDVVPTIAHTEQTVPAVDPTCSQTGLTEGTICSVCKTVIKAQETVKKLAHDYNTAVNVGDGLHRFTCEVCGVTRTEKHNFNTENVCAECNAKPETVFDLGGVGQKHDYVGAPVEEENKPDIANDETFDASKYTEIAKVESEEMEEATDKKNDYFFWSETMQIGHFKVYITYDADKIYIAAEVDTNAHANTDHMTFNLRTLKGLAKVKLGADKALVDEKNVVAVSNVFTSDNGNGGHVVVYAIEVNRDALADVITMADGEGTDNQLGLSAEYTNTTGTATFGAISDNTVTDAEGNNIISEGEVVPMLLTLSTEDDSSDTITGDGDSTSIDVSGVYNETEAEKIISVSLEWTVPTFTYTAQYKWNTTEFENELDTENSGWSTEPATIIIKNHSNQEISASFAFTQVADSNVKNVNGKFTESNDVNANAITNVLVDSAEPVEGEIKGEEKTATVYFFITEGTLAEGYDNRIGNITITIGAGNSN